MNKLSEWLETYFDEVEPKEFYRGVFPEGSFQKKGVYRQEGSSDWGYNGIIVSVTKEMKANGKPKIKRYTVTDDLDMIDQVCQTDDFCLMSPISYVGKERSANNARFLYAFAVDVDRIKVRDGIPYGLMSLWDAQIIEMDYLPKPTYIVSSGTGIHLYYVLNDPVAMFKDTSKQLQDLKRDLTCLIWNDAICDIKDPKEIQQEGIYQGFRVPGTITKTGSRARAFKTGEKIDIEELIEKTAGFRRGRESYENSNIVKKKKTLTLQKAKELYPDWYERRIEKKEKPGAWHVNRNVYEWWKTKVTETSVGHRYYYIMMLAIYARKCSMYDPKHNPNPVTYEELETDAFSFLDHLEGLTKDDNNHFTTDDIMKGLEAFQDKWITYPRNSADFKAAIRIFPNRRNRRKQAEHLQRARAVQAIDYPSGEWRKGNGRKSKEQAVREWCISHPGKRKADCIRETGLDRKTVAKWWITNKNEK